jgi:hypothetical protein
MRLFLRYFRRLNNIVDMYLAVSRKVEFLVDKNLLLCENSQMEVA